MLNLINIFSFSFFNFFSFFFLQGPPNKKRKLQYDRENLKRAFEATRKGVSVYRAARQYAVPESTLRDRHLGIVSVDTHIGFDHTFSCNEEEKLVSHISYMADIGYGYSKSAIQFMAWNYAKSLGKNIKAKESLSDNWFYGLLKRWPDLCVKKPQKLSIQGVERIAVRYSFKRGDFMRYALMADLPV
jgi:hypothetical protein